MDNQDMSIERANQILLGQVKSENKKIVRALSGKRSQELVKFINKMSREMPLLEREMQEIEQQ